MKNLFLMFLLSITLVGCGSLPWTSRPPIIEAKVTKIKVPEEFLQIPDYNPDINLDTATQKEVSKWIVDTEQRMQRLERNLQNIKEFNEKSITEKDIK